MANSNTFPLVEVGQVNLVVAQSSPGSIKLNQISLDILSPDYITVYGPNIPLPPVWLKVNTNITQASQKINHRKLGFNEVVKINRLSKTAAIDQNTLDIALGIIGNNYISEVNIAYNLLQHYRFQTHWRLRGYV